MKYMIQQKWGRNEEPGAPSLTASTVSFILFIYTKKSVYYVQDANYDPWSDFITNSIYIATARTSQSTNEFVFKMNKINIFRMKITSSGWGQNE
jgi:hypothetical protein